MGMGRYGQRPSGHCVQALEARGCSAGHGHDHGRDRGDGHDRGCNRGHEHEVAGSLRLLRNKIAGNYLTTA